MSEAKPNLYRSKQQALYNAHFLEDPTRRLWEFGFGRPRMLKDLENEFILTKLEFQPDEWVLDIGCNTGGLLNRLRLLFRVRGVGLDIAKDALQAAQSDNPLGNSYLVGDALDLPFADASFDKVVSFDVLEHLPAPDRCISEISRVLKPGGRALIYAISQRDRFTWHWFLHQISGGHWGQGLGSCQDHRRDYFVDPKAALVAAEQAGLVVEQIRYYHCFFTLAFDEAIIWLLSRILRFGVRTAGLEQTVPGQATGRPAILRRPAPWFYVYRILLRVIRLILLGLDWLWARAGYSNGFYLILKRTA